MTNLLLNPVPDAIASQLEPGEQLLWHGQPRPGIVFRPIDLFLIPFSLLWCGFAIVWETAVVTGHAPFFFALWGIPFVLFGIHFVVGRFFADAWRRAATFYAVTNERILLVSGIRSRTVKSIDLAVLSTLSVSERRSGEGTIMLGEDASWYWPYRGVAVPGMYDWRGPRLDLIPEARAVHQLIRAAQHAART